jgi:hypothetical protein
MIAHPSITGEEARQRHTDRVADARSHGLVWVSGGRTLRPKPSLGRHLFRRVDPDDPGIFGGVNTPLAVSLIAARSVVEGAARTTDREDVRETDPDEDGGVEMRAIVLVDSRPGRLA